MPLVSIIVPIYNVEPYLSRCIDSILAQSFTDFELILVDDGSPDGCPAICDEYAQKDGRIRVIHKENGGLSSARNAGMEIACGKYYLFCDSDDYVAPDWCAHFMDHANEAQEKFIFGGFTLVDVRTDPPEISYQCASDSVANYTVSDFLRLQINGKLGFACNVLYYADVLKRHDLKFSQEVIVEDLPFNLEYLQYMNGLTYTGYAEYFYVQYPRQTLSRKYYKDGFLRWKEKYQSTQKFIGAHVPESEQMELRQLTASSYLFNFLTALNHTFDKRNMDSLYKKIRFNCKVVRSEEFQHCLRYADTSRENPRYIALLKKGNYICAYLLQVIAEQKNRLKRSR